MNYPYNKGKNAVTGELKFYVCSEMRCDETTEVICKNFSKATRILTYMVKLNASVLSKFMLQCI
jgi:hypothetical protein